MSDDLSEPSRSDAMAHTELDGATTRRSVERSIEGASSGEPPGSGGETVGLGSRRLMRSDRLPAAGRYVVVRWLGAGGMGAVYEAFDPDLDRPVAIKVLHGTVDDEARFRMEREARALAKLSHPHVVQIYEVGQTEGRTFIAMEMVRGRSLDGWDDEARPWREVVQVYLQAGRGLAAAHAEGLVHRDFKPHNCILGDDGRVRVLDFGLARQQEFLTGRSSTRSAEHELPGPEPVSDQLTRTGAFVGTPAYVPLEQLEGRAVDDKSDQFSFCVALYVALSGERPYAGRTAGDLALALADEAVRPAPRDRAVPSRLRAVLLRGLRRDPAARWSSMGELLLQLERLVEPRRWRWVGGLVGAGLLATGVGLWQQARITAPRCEGAAAELSQVWDDERRAQVETSMLGTGLPYAADTWSRVRDGLDDYATAWTAMHTQTCEATVVRGEQTEAVMDLRMACLAGRRIALRETVQVLAQADADAVERASSLVGDLPRLSRCEDVEALRAEVAPPDDPDTARRVRTLRQQLARITAVGGVGRFSDALDEIEPLLAQAAATGYEPLLAEVEHRRGVLRQERGQYALAVEDLERAYARALEHGHDEVATHAAMVLVFVVGAQLDDYERAQQWGTTGLAFARRQRDAWAEGSVLANLGLVLRHQGQTELGLARLREALGIIERLRGPEHPDVAVILGGIATGLEDGGDLTGALEHLQRALSIDERALGSAHPHLATHLGNMGRILFKQGQPEQGRARLREALALYEQAGDRPSVAAVLDNLARIAFSQGRSEEAVELMTRAIDELEGSLGPEH
ncbi:MAG: serine/threonine-protein kinase, partial [Nannocystaceae bacterium]